jgi:hypothetical protein
MPVLSETTASSSLPGLDLPYVFIGGSLLLVLGVLISRKSKKSKSSKMSLLLPSEKSSPQPQETYIPPPMTFPQLHGHHPILMSRPPQPLPFTPPTLSTSIFPAPVPNESFSNSQPSSPSGSGLNQSYYDSPTTLEFEFPYDTTPSTLEPAALSSPRPGTDLPRRRSYTKTHSTSSTSSTGSTSSVTVTGEIIASDSWRRHTRVFGGGVCKACEESERRMSA